ncbi:prephenate dehydratase [Cladophialophora chaetospira]|uniref:prephenate dehydratase n=1 Tax=Cladophialophora chaetospira TaxID=386627 RepID=A0AA39CLG3_9EURO|nr:prephenate dehydratase [Cladophialophora chaetospira]
MAETPGSGHRRTLNVAYLGPEASFSHQAAIEVFQPSSSSAELQRSISLHPLPSFPAIFSAVQHSRPHPPQPSSSSPSRSDQQFQYDYALLPIENSTNGSVVQVLDLLAQCGLDSNALYPDLEVCAEYYLPVHHCLFVSSDASASTSSPLDNGAEEELRAAIRTLYTHPQVWGQCARYLSRFSPKEVERIDVGSTSAAAQLVSRQPNSPTTSGLNAAISSKLAGQRHGLLCLAENIEDEPGQNTTRFLVVRNKRHALHPHSTLDYASLQNNHGQGEERHKSLITFTIPHTKPGALADTLAVFKSHGFNLTSIDTRPSRRRSWQYVFFVECEEARPRKESTGEETRILEMVQELGKFTESLRYLGRFVDQLSREDEEGRNG